MKLKDSVVLVTGANRGLGLAITKELLERGARKVYAAARDPSTIKLAGVTPIQLDVNNPTQIAELGRTLDDVTFIINNAGIALGSSILSENADEALKAELDTNLYGPLRMAHAFAPTLKKNGGGAILNVLSVLSWLNLPMIATYSVSKAAAWSMTNALRGELKDQNTQVVALHVGYMDTDMTSGLDVPKASPRSVAKHALDVVEAGGVEVLADELTQQVKGALSAAEAPYLGFAG